MIEKSEVLTEASALGLSPDTVEKDYILSWLLHGINNNRDTSTKWHFKGGTCLKKCYFETWRFSEDLDFTLTDRNHLTKEFLASTFSQICSSLYDEVGIVFYPNKFKFKIIPKKNGNISVQGKIHYNGPLRRKQGIATIKLDLTNDEILVLKGKVNRVHHPYTDEPKDGIYALCYAFEEVIAEKIRALAQRVRPRDVYDVIHFFRNRKMIKNVQLVYNVLQKKCGFKKIDVPIFEHIENHEKIDELEAEWENMLSHQLPKLPPLKPYWEELGPFFDWLVGKLKEAQLTPVSQKDESVFQAGRIPNAYAIDAVLQRIQFAAANRVCVMLRYHEKLRTVEPLSFRISSAGNRLFYGYEREGGRPKAYSLEKIQGVEVSNLPYKERYLVEISASGKIAMPPLARKSTFTSGGFASSTKTSHTGPKYVFRCPYCDKLFYRKNNSAGLNPHKDKSGYKCPGRSGIYEDYR